MTDNVISAENQQERLDKEKLGYFLAGFVEGEGSFNVSLRKRPSYRSRWQVVPKFNVSQKDPTLLRILMKELNCGAVRIRKRDGLYFFEVTNPSDLLSKVIPYFKRFSLRSKSKIKNFTVFCEIVDLITLNKLPINLLTLRKVVELREILNKGIGRKRKYTISDILPYLESPQTTRQTLV